MRHIAEDLNQNGHAFVDPNFIGTEVGDLRLAQTDFVRNFHDLIPQEFAANSGDLISGEHEAYVDPAIA